MLLDYNGTLKILVERDGRIGIPDPDGSLSGDTLTVFPWEIFSAIITCGCLPMDYLPISLYTKIEEIVYKRALIEYVLKEENGYVVWNKDHLSELDPTERSFIAYYVGMFFANLIAQKLYGIDYLCHFRKFMDKTGSRLKRNDRILKGAHSEPDYIGLKYGIGQTEYYLFEAKGGEHKLKQSYDKALLKQLPAVQNIFGNIPKDRVLCYAVCDNNSLGNTDVLKIIIAKTTSTSLRAYDIVNDSGNAIGLFRSEMMLLSEEMGIVYNEEKYVKGFGRVQKERDDNGSALVWIIEYSEIDAIEIRFNHGDDICVTRHMTRRDSAVADEQVMLEEEINGVKRRVFPKE